MVEFARYYNAGLYCMLLPATLIIVIQTILLMIGIGHGGEGVEFSDTSGIDGLEMFPICQPMFLSGHTDGYDGARTEGCDI